MKAGTTSLFRDLSSHPQIYLPEEKEPESLVRHGESAHAVARDYDSLFGRARPGQIKGEASTAYAKRPDHDNVAEMARQVCGPLLKVIYITRDPIARIVSQYRHEFGLGEVTEDIDTAVLKYARYVNYSRYEWQLQPWLSMFGPHQVMVLSFERYVRERMATVGEVCRFLGVDPALLQEIDPGLAFNANQDKLVPMGMWKALVASRFYQRGVKPLVPHGFRQHIAKRVLSPSEKKFGDNERGRTKCGDQPIGIVRGRYRNAVSGAVMDKLDIVLLARNNPWLFSWRWKRLEHPNLHRRVVRPGDDVVIEGYPRSANTFATYAFEQAQGRPLKMGNHFHSPAQFHLAARYGIPAMLVIRRPRDAALSYMVFSPAMSAKEALRRYIGFHRSLIKISDRLVVAPFEEVTGDFDRPIQRLNRKFSTAFEPFNHTEARAKELLKRIDLERDARAGKHPELLSNALAKSVPSEAKDAARRAREQDFDSAALAGLRASAEVLYRSLCRL